MAFADFAAFAGLVALAGFAAFAAFAAFGFAMLRAGVTLRGSLRAFLTVDFFGAVFAAARAGPGVFLAMSKADRFFENTLGAFVSFLFFFAIAFIVLARSA